jgi:hypothetical protein
MDIVVLVYDVAILIELILSKCIIAMSIGLKSFYELVHICLNNSFREFRLHYTLCVWVGFLFVKMCHLSYPQYEVFYGDAIDDWLKHVVKFITYMKWIMLYRIIIFLLPSLIL